MGLVTSACSAQHPVQSPEFCPLKLGRTQGARKGCTRLKRCQFKPLNAAHNISQAILSKFYCAYYDVLSGCIKIYQEPFVIMKDLPFSSLTRHVKTKLYVISRVPNSEEKVTNPTSRTAGFSISGQSGFYTFM